MLSLDMPNTHAGVLTKLDIMDPGTDARGVLDGQEVKLKHGWVAVVNRGQQDINANASMQVMTLYRQRAVHGDANVPAHLLGTGKHSICGGMRITALLHCMPSQPHRTCGMWH